MAFSFCNIKTIGVVKKIRFLPWHYSEHKNVLLYCLNLYQNTYICYILKYSSRYKICRQTVKKRTSPIVPDILNSHSYMKNVKKRDKRLGVLFLQTFFDKVASAVLRLSIRMKTDEGRKRYEGKKYRKFLRNFDYFRKTSSPRYKRENQALFTMAFKQRGGDPLWNEGVLVRALK